MFENVRALFVVMALAVPAFYIAGQVEGSFISRREFVAWRNAWFAVSISAFLSIYFFAFALVVILVCAYTRSVQAATTGIFFVLLFAVPLVDIPIGGAGGIKLLLELNNGRLLAMFLLLRSCLRRAGPGDRSDGAYVAPDWLVLSVTYCLWLGWNFGDPN